MNDQDYLKQRRPTNCEFLALPKEGSINYLPSLSLSSSFLLMDGWIEKKQQEKKKNKNQVLIVPFESEEEEEGGDGDGSIEDIAEESSDPGEWQR